MKNEQLNLSVSSVSPKVIPVLNSPPKIENISIPNSTQLGNVVVQPGEVRFSGQKSNEGASSRATVHEVGAFILQQLGEMTAMKFQKLVYYCQAWSLVWDEEPLFNEEIQAWANGPVVPALYARHQGKFKVSEWHGKPETLTDLQRETILKVLEFYGDKPSQVLSDLTHKEVPWLNARKGLRLGERGSRVISLAAMAEYYSSL